LNHTKDYDLLTLYTHSETVKVKTFKDEEKISFKAQKGCTNVLFIKKRLAISPKL